MYNEVRLECKQSVVSPKKGGVGCSQLIAFKVLVYREQ